MREKKVVVGKINLSFKDLVEWMVLQTFWLGGAGACVELWHRCEWSICTILVPTRSIDTF